MAETEPQETHDTCETRETRETREDEPQETCDTRDTRDTRDTHETGEACEVCPEVAPVAPVVTSPPVAHVASVDPVDPVPMTMPTMPKLTSRKIGGLVTWVVDRHALAKAAAKISQAPDPHDPPSPISPQRRPRDDREVREVRGDGSPKTPSFKPSLPRRAFKEANRLNGPECDAKCDGVPEKVAVAHTGQKESERDENDETQNEDSDSDACCSETETPSASNSPCSASEDPSERQAFQGHGYPYGVPFWPVYFPVAGCQPNWWNVNEIAAQHLDACQKIALQRAERRRAPTKETCCVGCCCPRCIGIPAAYQPKKSEETLLKEKDEEAKPKTLESENQGKDCDTISVQESLQETASSTSVSSGSSDSDMDVDEILRQLPPTRALKWITPDPRLQHHLRGPKLLRTVVCTNLHTDAIATDVHQAFQQRFNALPDFVDGYWKEGGQWLESLRFQLTAILNQLAN